MACDIWPGYVDLSLMRLSEIKDFALNQYGLRSWTITLCCFAVVLLYCFRAFVLLVALEDLYLVVLLSSCRMLLSTSAEIACTSNKYPLTSTCTILQPALTSGP